MRIALMIALLATLLAGCSGSTQTTSYPASWSVNGLTFAYPYDGQQQVIPTAPVVLHFSAPLTDTDPAVIAGHITFTDAGSNAVPFTLTSVDANQGVVLTPDAPLAPNSSYTVNWSNLGIAGGMVQPLPQGIRFSTRPGADGPRSQAVAGAFTVGRVLPDNPAFPIMDFSSLRLQFTQPVARSSLVYGNSLRLEDGAGNLVPATVLLTDRRLTVDPVHDLTPGQTYTLKLTNAVHSTYGDSLDPGNFAAWSFVPHDSAPLVTQALQVPDSGSGAVISPLTGAAINNVPIQSALLGNNSASQQSGNLYAQLAFVPHYPDAVPMTVRKGNLLTGASVQVQIAGQVPAGLDTGAIKVQIISDANGYMIANPYSTLATAPRLVYLTMDVAMSSANAAANGAFNQNIPHVEVVGTAIVKDNKFTMDAVGVVELQVLGLDHASGVLSFHLEGYADQTTAPPQVADTTAPTLQSWTPGSKADQARPGDPVTLTFDEALDPDSVNAPGAVTLEANGSSVPFTTHVDGTSVVLTPQSPLAHNVNYTVLLSQQITDLAGNSLDQAYTLGFALPALSNPATRSPIALTTYPGFPCATTGRNAASNQQGTCAGVQAADDVLPIPDMPASRSIAVRFSQNIDPASVGLATSCTPAAGDPQSLRVETLDSSGNCTGVVSGRLQVMPQEIRFTPDTPWVSGQLYHYVLGSTTGTAVCDGTQSVCGSNGLPLQTAILTVTSSSGHTSGGPPLDIWFHGGPDSSNVFQSLRSLPDSDVNANFVHDAGEADAVADGNGGYTAPNAAQVAPDTANHNPPYSGLISGFNIGCPQGQTCPLNTFVFVNSALNAEVAGYDANLGGVKVLIHPTALVTTSFDIYASATGATISNPIASGPQVIRLRYEPDPNNAAVRNQPITGVITSTPSGPVLSATLHAYLDLPELNPTASILGVLPPTSLAHNLHSYPLTIVVAGPVTFLDDGRMVASLANTAAVPITVSTSAFGGLIPAGNIYLTIPAGAMRVVGVSPPVKPD